MDFLWPEQRLVVEADGFGYHGTREAFERDRARDADLQARGYRVLRVTHRQLSGIASQSRRISATAARRAALRPRRIGMCPQPSQSQAQPRRPRRRRPRARPATPEAAKKPAKKDAGELFLIDGNSMAYRAFFALPESIATHDGRPTNAIYGLASMFAKMLTDHQPKAVVVAWDAGWSGREKTYEPYKAQRKSRPDLLKEQWPHLMPLAEAFGFTNVKVEGYEADDVIAVADQARPRAGDRRDGRLGRPRRLPAGRGRGAGDDDLARRHRHQDLRPRRA